MTKCPHGSRYDSGCRCDTCVSVHSEYNHRAMIKKAQRAWGNQFPTDRLDPTYAMKLVCDAVATRGMSYVAIARAADINKKTVRNIYLGKNQYVLRWVEDRLRQTLDTDWINLNRTPATLVDRDPYRNWVQRLMAQGWTTTDLIGVVQENSNYRYGWLHNISRRTGKHFMIEWQNAQACMWLVDFIGDRKGPSTRTALRMQNRGIFPTIHYTENGELIEQSLLPDQRRILKGLRSRHGKSSRRGSSS